MLDIPELLKIIKELNKEIETGIDNLSTIETISLQTNGNDIYIFFSDSLYWTNDEEEINSKKDLQRILLERLRSHKTQVDGMINLYEEATEEEEE